LVEKEYIIVFVYIFSTIANHTIWIATPKRITHQCTYTGSMFTEPNAT
jgi:hypothetical protein